MSSRTFTGKKDWTDDTDFCLQKKMFSMISKVNIDPTDQRPEHFFPFTLYHSVLVCTSVRKSGSSNDLRFFWRADHFPSWKLIIKRFFSKYCDIPICRNITELNKFNTKFNSIIDLQQLFVWFHVQEVKPLQKFKLFIACCNVKQQQLYIQLLGYSDSRVVQSGGVRKNGNEGNKRVYQFILCRSMPLQVTLNVCSIEDSKLKK